MNLPGDIQDTGFRPDFPPPEALQQVFQEVEPILVVSPPFREGPSESPSLRSDCSWMIMTEGKASAVTDAVAVRLRLEEAH